MEQVFYLSTWLTEYLSYYALVHLPTLVCFWRAENIQLATWHHQEVFHPLTWPIEYLSCPTPYNALVYAQDRGAMSVMIVLSIMTQF
jgi:hypothetical protein